METQKERENESSRVLTVNAHIVCITIPCCVRIRTTLKWKETPGTNINIAETATMLQTYEGSKHNLPRSGEA